jgi:hypothetical protein
MRLRLAGVNDLIAAEGKYHNKCLNAFKYDTQKTKKECETIDLAMTFLVQKLGYAASKNQEVLPKEVASMHEESTGFPFQKSTDEVGVKIDIRH